MPQPYVAIQAVMMPRDTNPHGTIFGGVILSYIDQAGAIAARHHILQKGGSNELKFVTVAVNRVEFKQPVLVGDVVRFETMIVRVGRTSVTVYINVIAERNGREFQVTDSEVVYVGVNADRQPQTLLPGPG